MPPKEYELNQWTDCADALFEKLTDLEPTSESWAVVKSTLDYARERIELLKAAT